MLATNQHQGRMQRLAQDLQGPDAEVSDGAPGNGAEQGKPDDWADDLSGHEAKYTTQDRGDRCYGKTFGKKPDGQPAGESAQNNAGRMRRRWSIEMDSFVAHVPLPKSSMNLATNLPSALAQAYHLCAALATAQVDSAGWLDSNAHILAEVAMSSRRRFGAFGTRRKVPALN